MSRVKQTEEVRRKIVSTALKLFLKKGYAHTTLREISSEAGVSYGSIYHHFVDKDDIFREIVLENFERVQSIANNQLEREDNVYLRLGLKWAALIQGISSDAQVAELFSVAYRSWKISEVLINIASQRHQEWLKAELPDWSESHFYAATLVLTGGISAIVDEKLNQDRLCTEDRIQVVLSSALPCFGANPVTTQKIINQVVELAQLIASDSLTQAIQ